MEWLTGRFDKIRELNFESCPGESRCETKEGNRINRELKRNPETPIDQICRDCRLKETKPGREPVHLAEAIHLAYELEEDSFVCGGFDYPAILEYFDPFEWVCLVSIKAARQTSDNKAHRQPQEQATGRAQTLDHLKQLSHGK
jgi:hypothetical protein